MAEQTKNREVKHQSNWHIIWFSAPLLLFILWTSLTAQPVFLTFNSRYSIFSRHYRQYGLSKTHFLSYYNFELTDPPSTPYVSFPPLVPMIMYGASLVGQDRPATYYGVIIVFHIICFCLLSYLVFRRWGKEAALWTLLLVVLNKYAMTYGNQQTPELPGVIASFTAIFLYFEWLNTRKTLTILLSIAAYLIGLASDYRLVLSGFVIGIHWLFFIPGKKKSEWLKMLLFPVGSLGFAGLMIGLMWRARIPMSMPFRRALFRSSANLQDGLPWAFVKYPVDLLGPVMLLGCFVFVGFILFLPGFRQKISSDASFQLLVCLGVSSALPPVLFGQAFLIHQFLVMHFLPFFAVTGALGIATFWRVWNSPRLKYLSSFCLVTIALLSSLVGNSRLAYALGSSPKNPSPYKRIQMLAQQIKPQLRQGDRLVVLNAEEPTPAKVTAFYELWIPSVDYSEKGKWTEVVSKRRYRLILAPDTTSFQWLQSRPDVRLLAADGSIGFFEDIVLSD